MDTFFADNIENGKKNIKKLFQEEALKLALKVYQKMDAKVQTQIAEGMNVSKNEVPKKMASQILTRYRGEFKLTDKQPTQILSGNINENNITEDIEKKIEKIYDNQGCSPFIDQINSRFKSEHPPRGIGLVFFKNYFQTSKGYSSKAQGNKKGSPNQ